MDNLILGFSMLLQPEVFYAVLIGCFAGILVGLLPGLSPASGVALLVPFTFGMSPLAGIAMLAALYSTSSYGGSITAITINTPGDPASAATVIDGYALTKKGLTGKALRISLYSCFAGSLISLIILIIFARPIASFALRFGPAEYFALAIFGLTVVATLVGKNWLKGLLAVAFGLYLATIGVDPFTGFPRFTFGHLDLYTGLDIVPVLIGLFAIAEVFREFEETDTMKKVQAEMGKQLPTWAEMKSLVPTVLRSSAIGSLIGAIPGAGATIASFVAYSEAKRFSKKPEEFGHGSLEGIAAPETANDAAVKGAMIPLLTLGLPGSATTAILLGAFMIHNLIPGPLLFKEHPDIVYGLFASFLVANIVLLVVGLTLNRLFIKLIGVSRGIVAPIILGITIIGAYSIGNSMFNVFLALVFGVLGYIFQKIDIPVAPIVLGLVLGEIVETNLRRALMLSEGSWTVFVNHPISLVLLILSVLSLVYPIMRNKGWFQRVKPMKEYNRDNEEKKRESV